MSVRSERIIYKERDRETERVREEPRKTYTTIKRYQVPEGTTRSVYRDDTDFKEEKIIIRRERKEESPPPPPPLPLPREEVEYRLTDRTRERGRESSTSNIDIRFSERSRDPPRGDDSYKVIEREVDWDRGQNRGSRTDFRFVEHDREVIRAPSPPSPERFREYRFERERDFSPLYRDERPYELERYSKSTEYFAQPQPIIIRESAPQPIIIREGRREPQKIIIRREEPQYEFIEREEVKEEKQLVKREEPAPPATVAEAPSPSVKSKAPEEDYFYERRVIERNRDRRRSSSHDRRTEIHPRDSASQYSSDDSYEYVRRERRTSGSRDRSPHHKRHLVEGAVAGAAAGEIIRHHRMSQGEKAPGRGRSLVGGAALGAVGAEALSRVRSMTRRGSRSSSRSESFGRRRDRRRHRSRSRSKSLSRAQQLGGLAAVAAVGALAGYALKKGGNKETVVINENPRRSRSRRRRASVDVYATNDADRAALNPEHRNRRIAQAGLASAAAAGIWEKVRSRSRGGKARSRSRLQQGVPIAAAGLGGAALAGLYEKNKANKEAKKEAIVREELSRGRRRRSRSRSRSVPASAPYPMDDRRATQADRDMVAYGHEPIYPDQRGQYSDDEPGMYRRRHRGGSDDGSSPDTRGYRSHSRGKRWAETGLAAGAGAYAERELADRRDRSRYRDGADDQYMHEPYARDRGGAYSPTSRAGYLPEQQAAYDHQPTYPSGNYFPPPPTGEYAQMDAQPAAMQTSYPAYNPADYASGNANTGYASQSTRGAFGERDLNQSAPQQNETFAGDNRYGGARENQAGHQGPGRDPENVSATENPTQARDPHTEDGVVVPTDRSSTSRVRFDLEMDSNQNAETTFRDDSRRSFQGTERSTEKTSPKQRLSGRNSNGFKDDQSDSASDDTEELPARFDENGEKKPDAMKSPHTFHLNKLFDVRNLNQVFEGLRSTRGSTGGNA